MKKIFLIIGLLVTVFAGAQTLPPGFTKISQKYMWLGMMPSDTSNSKYGLGAIGDSVYWGNGTRWRNISRDAGVYASDSVYKRNDSLFYTRATVEKFTGVVLQPISLAADHLPGDIFVLDSDNNTATTKHPDQTACNNTGNISLSYNSGLTYDYNAGDLTINCITYHLTQGQITAAVGTAGPGEFREDLVYGDASGIHIRTGTNSIGGVGEKDFPDPATEIGIGYIRIDSNNVVPTDITNTKVYYNHTRPGEWLFSTAGTITATPNYTTNPFSPADSSIRVTAASNNGLFRFTDTLNYSKSLYTNLSFEARNNATFNNARNWVVRLFNGTTQVGNAVIITNWGYSKTTLNTWMLVSIPMSAFGGSDVFNRVEFRNTGTGGTVNVQFGDIKFQKGIVIGNPGTTGDFLPKTFTEAQTITGNGNDFSVRNAFTNFQNKDSVGYVLNYPWSSTSLLPYLTDVTPGATVTQGGSYTIVNGAAYSLANYFTAPINVGVENWTIEFDIQHTTVNSTNRGVLVGLNGTLSGLGIQFNTSDTAKYISKMDGMLLQDGITNNKLSTNFILNNGDIVHYKVVKFRRSVTATMHNMTNGSESKLVNYGAYPQVGAIELHFLNAGDTKLINNFTFKYDEVKNPEYMYGINSITWGSAGDSYNDGHAVKTLGKLGVYGVMEAAPGELTTQLLLRIPDILLIHPTVFSYGNPVNDLGAGTTLANYGSRMRTFASALVSAGIKLVLISGTPSNAGDVRPYNDTLQAIETSFGTANVKYVDVFTKMKKSGGNDMLDMYNSGDGIHPNNIGHEVISAAEYDAVNAFLGPKKQILTAQVPFNPNTSLDVVTVDGQNRLFRTPIFLDTFHVKIFPTYTAQLLQNGNAMIGGGFYAQELRIGGNSGFGTPNLSVLRSSNPFLDGVVIATKFMSGAHFSIGVGAADPYMGGGSFYFADNSNIQMQTQSLPFIFNGPQSASNGIVIQPGNQTGHQGIGWNAFSINDRLGVMEFGMDSINNPYIKNFRDGSAASADSVMVVINGHLGVKNISTGGSTTFTGLSDVPGGGFTGQSLKAVRVNAGETALEYYTTSGGGWGTTGTVATLTGASTLSGAGNPLLFDGVELRLKDNSGAGNPPLAFYNSSGSRAFRMGATSYFGVANADIYVYNDNTGKFSFGIDGQTDNNYLANENGNVIIGGGNGYMPGASANGTLQFAKAATNPTGNTTGAQLFSDATTGELMVRDPSGNVTGLGPHPDWLKNKPMHWGFNSYNETYGKHVKVDMYEAIETIDKLSKEIEELRAMVYKLSGKQYKKKKPIKLLKVEVIKK